MITFNNISHNFGSNQLFNDFSLTIENNEKIVLNAPSGTGKSTLLKMAMGFVQPQFGNIRIDNSEISERTVTEIRTKISYISQQVHFPTSTTEDFITQILSYKVNRHIPYSRESVIQWLVKFDLDRTIINSNLQDLSGGEKQRIAIIIALMLKRKILLLDEVTSGLDSDLKMKVVTTIASTDTTAIIVSHDKEWFSCDNFRIVTLPKIGE